MTALRLTGACLAVVVGVAPENENAAFIEERRTKDSLRFRISFTGAEDAADRCLGSAEHTMDAVAAVMVQHGFPFQVPREPLNIVLLDDASHYPPELRPRMPEAIAVTGFYDEELNKTYLVNLRTRHRETAQFHVYDKMTEQEGSSLEVPSTSYSEGFVRGVGERVIQTVQPSLTDAALEQAEQLTVQHEIAHQVFFNCGVLVRGGAYPIWLREGLACLFEVPMPCCRDGIVPINWLRHADIAAPRDLPSVKDLLTMPRAWDRDPVVASRRYAHAWSLTHMLLHRRPREMREYLRVLAARPTGSHPADEQEWAEFEAAFGPVDEVDGAWRAYVTELSAAFRRSQPPPPGAGGPP